MNNQNSTNPALNASEDLIDEILENEGYEGFVAGLFNRSGDLSKDFAHAVLGLRTECYELLSACDTVNAVEEAGDLEFYHCAAMLVMEDFTGQKADESLRDIGVLSSHPVVAYGLEHTAQETMEHALNHLEDVAKRWVGYGKAPTEPVASILLWSSAAIRSVQQLSVLRSHLSNPERFANAVIRTNVAKLLHRYKGRAFDANLAVNRDTASERQVMADVAQA